MLKFKKTASSIKNHSSVDSSEQQSIMLKSKTSKVKHHNHPIKSKPILKNISHQQSNISSSGVLKNEKKKSLSQKNNINLYNKNEWLNINDEILQKAFLMHNSSTISSFELISSLKVVGILFLEENDYHKILGSPESRLTENINLIEFKDLVRNYCHRNDSIYPDADKVFNQLKGSNQAITKDMLRKCCLNYRIKITEQVLDDIFLYVGQNGVIQLSALQAALAFVNAIK